MEEKAKCILDMRLNSYTDPKAKGEESTGCTFFGLAQYHKGDSMGVTLLFKNRKMVVVNADLNMGMNNNRLLGAGHVIEGKVTEKTFSRR